LDEPRQRLWRWRETLKGLIYLPGADGRKAGEGVWLRTWTGMGREKAQKPQGKAERHALWRGQVLRL